MKKISVKGAIISNDDKWIYDLFEYESTCPKDITAELEGLTGEPVQVTINSGGGSVYDASEIYTELKDYPGNVEVRIVGLAASAASVIAMAGDTVRMSPTAEIMVHNAAMVAWGDHRDMDKASEMLKVTNKSIAAAYRQKSGMSEEDLLNLMNEETWMTAEAAKEKGLVDEIMFEDASVRMIASAPGALPQQVINKVRNDALKKPPTVTMDEIKNMLSQMKSEIINELKPKEEPAAEPGNQNLSTLFLQL
ncbi:head maturation protease, ClpP-related [Metabacillus sp. 84]|uniref:head maturation protease, ClpP-related n=1 Tax=Metabacillus sp. 84 TaxID=3404705 RepID=UPI003CF7AB17